MRATGIVPALHETPLRDCDGVAVGVVEDLLCDARTHRPMWLVVRLDDGRRTLVPALRLRPRARWRRDVIEACPAGPDEVLRACRHYGVALRGTGALAPVRDPGRTREPAAA